MNLQARVLLIFIHVHLSSNSGIADWTNREEDPSDVNVWEDNWDDDNVEDDFSVQLKSELESQGVAMEQS